MRHVDGAWCWSCLVTEYGQRGAMISKSRRVSELGLHSNHVKYLNSKSLILLYRSAASTVICLPRSQHAVGGVNTIQQPTLQHAQQPPDMPRIFYVQHSTTASHVSERRFSFINRRPVHIPLAPARRFARRLPLAIPEDIVRSPQATGQPRLSSRKSRTKLEVPASTSAPEPGQEAILEAGRTPTPAPNPRPQTPQRTPITTRVPRRSTVWRGQEAPGIVRAGGSAAISSAAAGWLVSLASATSWPCMDVESATTTPGIRAIRGHTCSVLQFHKPE